MSIPIYIPRPVSALIHDRDEAIKRGINVGASPWTIRRVIGNADLQASPQPEFSAVAQEGDPTAGVDQ